MEQGTWGDSLCKAGPHESILHPCGSAGGPQGWLLYQRGRVLPILLVMGMLIRSCAKVEVPAHGGICP